MVDYLIYKSNETEVDLNKVKQFESHGDFNKIGVQILQEIGTLVITISAIVRKDNTGKIVPFNKEEAALVGNLVRFGKLGVAFVEQFTKPRLETSMIFFRCMAETYVNLKYFLKFGDQHTLKHYIKNSLRQEWKLLEIIREKTKDKEVLLDIEKRMIESIQRSFDTSEFNSDEMNNSSKWDTKIKERISEIIDPSFYTLIYGNGSHAIHGNWQDIINFHLEKHEDGFIPDTTWTMPTFQLINAATILSCDLLRNYCEEVLPNDDEKTKLLHTISDIGYRSMEVDKLHEEFMKHNR